MAVAAPKQERARQMEPKSRTMLGNDREQSQKRQIYCGGRCVTGPTRGNVAPIAVLALVALGTTTSSTFLTLEVVHDLNVSLSIQFLVTVLLGMWTIILQFLVWCSDPGIVSRRQDLHSQEAIQQFMSLNSQEAEVQDTDPVYMNSAYYKPRNCDTCRHIRPAKASHCGMCGHCVHGWDHHCVALNNCVGRRNIRSFVGFLIVSTVFSAMVIISSLLILMLDRDYSPSSTPLRIGTASGLLASAVTLFLTIKARFRNVYRLTCVIVGFLLSWALTLAFARDLASVLAAITINFALGYILVIKGMLSEYIDLVSRHMTMKERAARKRSSREQNIKDEPKNGPVLLADAMRNHYRFFCKKKIPKSNRPFSPR